MFFRIFGLGFLAFATICGAIWALYGILPAQAAVMTAPIYESHAPLSRSGFSGSGLSGSAAAAYEVSGRMEERNGAEKAAALPSAVAFPAAIALLPLVAGEADILALAAGGR